MLFILKASIACCSYLDLCPETWNYNKADGICYSPMSTTRTNFYLARKTCESQNYLESKILGINELKKMDPAFFKDKYNATFDPKLLWASESYNTASMQ